MTLLQDTLTAYIAFPFKVAFINSRRSVLPQVDVVMYSVLFLYKMVILYYQKFIL